MSEGGVGSEAAGALESLTVPGVGHGGVEGHGALLYQLAQGLVHSDAAVPPAQGDEALNLGGLSLADEVADGVRHDHDLAGGDAPAAGPPGQQLLGQDGPQGSGQLKTYLLLLGGGEHIDHAVHRVGSGVGVQGGEHQMACLRGGQRRLDGVQVPHLADEDNIGVLAEDGPQAVGIGAGVRADLPLVHDAAIRHVDVLDGVLQRDDVGVSGVVDAVQQGRQRGGLAGARLARDQHDAAAVGGEIRHHRRQGQLVQRGDMVGQQTDGGGDAALLAEQIDAGASPVGERAGHVQLADVRHGLVFRTGQLTGQHLAVGGGEHLAGEVGNVSVYTALRRKAADDMNVGGPHGARLLNELIQ